MVLGLFSLYNYIENYKNLLVRNHWTNFSITWQKNSFDKAVEIRQWEREGAGVGEGAYR